MVSQAKAAILVLMCLYVWIDLIPRPTHGFNVASKSIYPPFIADEQCDGTVIWIFMTVQPLREFNIITMQNPPQEEGCKQMMWNYI